MSTPDRLVPDTHANTHDGQRQVPHDRPDIRTQLTGSFIYVDQRYLRNTKTVRQQQTPSRANADHSTRDASRDTRLSNARTTTPRRSRRDPRRASRSLSGAAQSYIRGRANKAAGLSDTAGLPIGARNRNSEPTRCTHWRTCWIGSSSGGTTCPPASKTARRQKPSMLCWSCAVTSKNSAVQLPRGFGRD